VTQGSAIPASSAAIEKLDRDLDREDRIVFDLDGTLYDTRDFERPALAAIADWLRHRSGLSLDLMTEALWRRRETQRHRPGLFDDLLAEYGLPSSWGIECLRRLHEDSASQLANAESLKSYVHCLRNSGRKLALVSNGPHDLQKRKTDVLCLSECFDIRVFCGPDQPERQKPSAWAWAKLADWRGNSPSIYVGDDAVDEQFAKSGGARFVQFRFRSSKYAN
jgi:FMN phosphatase YigB (HAD superfamily)